MTDSDPQNALIDDPNVEASIGRVVISWAFLERQLDATIADLLRLDSDLGLSVTANLGTKAKIEMIQAVGHHLASFLHPVRIEDINKLASDTSTATADHRNAIAHGQPWEIDPAHLSDDAPLTTAPAWLWLKASARKGGARFKGVTVTSASFDEWVLTIKALTDRWRRLRSDMEFGLTSYDFYKREEGRQ